MAVPPCLQRCCWLFLSALLGLGLVPARDARGASTDCSGTWRFDLARPTTDQEPWLWPDSWCRGKRLPRTFTVEARRGPDGSMTLTGTPLPPADIIFGGGRCEFQFSGPEMGPSKYHELTIEVNASGSIVQGKAHCAERTRDSADKASGVAIDVAVTGSHAREIGAPVPVPSAPPAPMAAAIPSAPDGVAASVAAACRQRDPDALWKLLTARFRLELDKEATRVRHAVPASDLGKLFRHEGRAAEFKGRAFLRYVVATESPRNPCWGVDHWEMRPAVATEGGYVVTVQTENAVFGLRIKRGDRGWQLDRVSKATGMHKR